MTRAEHAKQLFEEGYACSQAVALAFKDLTNVNEIDLKKLTLPLGGGLGRLRLTCGAITGLAVIVGLVFAKDENTSENKLATYKIIQDLTERFKTVHGTIICEELLSKPSVSVEIGGVPSERTKEYYKERPCSLIVYNAAKVLEDYLTESKIL